MNRLDPYLRRLHRGTQLYLELVRDLAPELAGQDRYRKLYKWLGRTLDEDQPGSVAGIAEQLYELLGRQNDEPA